MQNRQQLLEKIAELTQLDANELLIVGQIEGFDNKYLVNIAAALRTLKKAGDSTLLNEANIKAICQYAEYAFYLGYPLIELHRACEIEPKLKAILPKMINMVGDACLDNADIALDITRVLTQLNEDKILTPITFTAVILLATSGKLTGKVSADCDNINTITSALSERPLLERPEYSRQLERFLKRAPDGEDVKTILKELNLIVAQEKVTVSQLGTFKPANIANDNKNADLNNDDLSNINSDSNTSPAKIKRVRRVATS